MRLRLTFLLLLAIALSGCASNRDFRIFYGLVVEYDGADSFLKRGALKDEKPGRAQGFCVGPMPRFGR